MKKNNIGVGTNSPTAKLHIVGLVKCQECTKAGIQSKVYPGQGSITLMSCQPFYDENGQYHIHDMNTTTTLYTCSEGHEWAKTTTGSCWCGWPNLPDKLVIKTNGNVGIGA